LDPLGKIFAEMDSYLCTKVLGTALLSTEAGEGAVAHGAHFDV